MAKRALINIFNTDGIIDFAKSLTEKAGFSVTATEKARKFLAENGIQTEEFDWNNADFDVYVINFDTFDKYQNKDMELQTILNQIDNIGFSLLEKAVKNFEKSIILTNPNQYKSVLSEIISGDISSKENLLKEAIMLNCQIHSSLLNVLNNENQYLSLTANKATDLLHGENPYQKASLYAHKTVSYDIISEDALSYNDLTDINLATAIAAEFYDVSAAILTKLGLTCAAALGSDAESAFNKAIDCDPISVFGSAAAFTRPIDEKFAKTLSTMKLKIISAPDFSTQATEILQSVGTKLIKINTPLKDFKKYLNNEIKVTPFGILSQQANTMDLLKDSFKLVTKKKPTTEIIEDMVFGWKVAKYTRSKSALVVKDLKTTGISQGQTNLIEAIDIALDKACEKSKDAILVTDGEINTIEAIQDSAQGRIAGIICAGCGSKKAEITALADKYEITMITTGLKQYKQ